MANFWSRVEPEPNTGCWLWTGYRFTRKWGYGQVGVGGRTVLAHRFAYTQTRGEIPEGMCVCHRCDNPPCVNPAHLFLGTTTDNIRDAKAKGRLSIGTRHGSYTRPERHSSRLHPESRPRGEKHWQSKLTGEQIVEIRRLAEKGLRHRVIGSMFGIAQTTVSRIARGVAWVHI